MLCKQWHIECESLAQSGTSVADIQKVLYETVLLVHPVHQRHRQQVRTMLIKSNAKRQWEAYSRVLGEGSNPPLTRSMKDLPLPWDFKKPKSFQL